MKRQFRDEFIKIWLFDDKELRNEMILKYLEKVKSYLISFGCCLPEDELTSEAYMILDTIIENYKYSKNPSFDLFIEKEVKKILMNKLEERNVVLYNDLIHTNNNNSLLDDYLVLEDRKLLYNLLNMLSNIERMVIEMFFGLYDGKCYKIDEISKTLRIKEVEVSKIIHSCLEEFREILVNKSFQK